MQRQYHSGLVGIREDMESCLERWLEHFVKIGKKKHRVDFDLVIARRVRGEELALARGAALCCFVCLTFVLQDAGS